MLFNNDFSNDEYIVENDFVRIRQVRVNEAVEATLNGLHIGNIDTIPLETLSNVTYMENEVDYLLKKLEHQQESQQEKEFIVAEFDKLLSAENQKENA